MQNQPFDPGISGPLGPRQPEYVNPYEAALGLPPGNEGLAQVIGPIVVDQRRDQMDRMQRQLQTRALNQHYASYSGQSPVGEISAWEAIRTVGAVVLFPVTVPYFVGRAVARRLRRR